MTIASSNYRPLNNHQLTILNTLYKFRFLTASLLAKNQSANNVRVISNRLKLLVDQEYLAMNYDSSYRIAGKPATYYLTTKAIRYLRNKPYTNESALRSIYHDKRASATQIAHRLAVFDAYIELKIAYKDRFKFFSNSELTSKPYVPRDRPDAYIVDSQTSKSYFLEYLRDDMNYWTLKKAIKRYVSFAETDTWQKYKDSPFPDVLLLCESSKLAYRAKRMAEGELDSSYVDIKFKTASTMEDLFSDL